MSHRKHSAEFHRGLEKAHEQAQCQLAFKTERRRHVEKSTTEKVATAEEAVTAEVIIIGWRTLSHIETGEEETSDNAPEDRVTHRSLT